MSLRAIEEVIGDRIVASLANQSVDVQGVWSNSAPRGTELKQGDDPVIVFTLDSGEADDTFNDNGFRLTYTVSCHDSRANGSGAADDANDAVNGDGTPDTAPTFGLHRWEPSPTGFNASQMGRVAVGSPHDGDAFVFTTTFQMWVEEI